MSAFLKNRCFLLRKALYAGLFFAGLCCYADEGCHVVECRILDYGTYQRGSVTGQVKWRDVKDRDNGGSEADLVDKYIHIQTTTNVSAQKGVSFGYSFIVEARTNCHFSLVLTGPMPFGSAGGASSEELFEFPISVVGRQRCWHVFTFDNNDKIRTGNWSLRILHEGKIVGEKDFQVQDMPTTPSGTANGRK